MADFVDKAPVEFLAAWQVTATAAGLGRETIEGLGAELLTRHRELHRSYHTVDHVKAVLRNLDRLDARSCTTELAAFFHDAIYDPVLGDNEQRSADLAAAWLVGVSEVSDVVAIINATAGHQLVDNAPAGCAEFLDADLAILGAEPHVYDKYAAAIAAEYSHMPSAEFRAGRAAVLAHFVERDALFFTDRGQELWEQRARANLTRELITLTG